jgi:hypothetical protein
MITEAFMPAALNSFDHLYRDIRQLGKFFLGEIQSVSSGFYIGK